MNLGMLSSTHNNMGFTHLCLLELLAFSKLQGVAAESIAFSENASRMFRNGAIFSQQMRVLWKIASPSRVSRRGHFPLASALAGFVLGLWIMKIQHILTNVLGISKQVCSG